MHIHAIYIHIPKVLVGLTALQKIVPAELHPFQILHRRTPERARNEDRATGRATGEEERRRGRAVGRTSSNAV